MSLIHGPDPTTLAPPTPARGPYPAAPTQSARPRGPIHAYVSSAIVSLSLNPCSPICITLHLNPYMPAHALVLYDSLLSIVSISYNISDG